MSSNFLIGLFGAIGSISWCGVYVLALYCGWRDKTYSIPIPAIVANVAWELLYSTVFNEFSPVGPYIPIVWLILDVALLLQAAWYRPTEFPSMSTAAVCVNILAGMVFCLTILYYAELQKITYISSAFPQNLMMSMLFVSMLRSRGNTRGQSLYIAALKLIGTAMAMAVGHAQGLTRSGIYVATFIAIEFYDFYYLAALYFQMRLAAKAPR